jgi:hypothetical protein
VKARILGFGLACAAMWDDRLQQYSETGVAGLEEALSTATDAYI